MHSNYLSQIKLTHFSDKFIASNTAGQVITMLDLYNNHVNGISGSLQSNISGYRLSQINNSENYIINYTEGLIFIDIDNHGEIYWQKDRTLEIANSINTSFNSEAGYIWTEFSKSGTGLHMFFFIPLCSTDEEERYKEYYINIALTYNKIYNKLLEILPKINSNINSDTILKDILDFHNFKLTQLFDYTDTTILLNQTYNRDIAAFNSFCDNIKEGYKQFISNYGDYFKALSMAKVNSTIIDIVKKKLFKKEDITVNIPTVNYNVFAPLNISKLQNTDLVFDYNNRMQLVYTLKNFFSVEDTIRIAIQFYDLYHNPDSNRVKAISNIKSLAKESSLKTPNIRIINFLQKHGFLINTEIQQPEKPKFFGIEGTGINGQPADETIYLGDKFISDYYDTIIRKLSEHKNVYIKAGCGVGKSTFFRTLIEKEDKVCIVCHLNSIKEGVYGKRQKSNTDFNDIEKLFGSDYTLDTLKNYLVGPDKINAWINANISDIDKKIVVSWDGYQKLLENGYDKILDSYVKCLDESHNLVDTLKYRNKTEGFGRKSLSKKEGTISALTNPKYNFRKTIFCSGTPQNEFQLFKDVYKFEFLKEDPINYTWEYVQINAENCEGRGVRNKGINAFIEWFNTQNFISSPKFGKILIYNDYYNSGITDSLSVNNVDFCNFKREVCKDGNYYTSQILYNNNLINKLMVSTVYGSQGIEIKNNIDNLLCIFIQSDITKTDIIQAIHRFRNVKNVHSIIVELTPTLEEDIRISSTMKDALKTLENISPELKKELQENKNYFATRLLLKDNTGYTDHDILLAGLYYNYLEQEKVNYAYICKWFGYMVKNVYDISSTSSDVSPLEKEVMEYEVFRTDNIEKFYDYTGIIKSDTFIGAVFPNYVLTNYTERKIEKDLQIIQKIKYLVSPQGENYNDVNTELITKENFLKIVKMFTHLKNYTKEKELIGIENIFRLSAAYEFLKARNRIHKHLVSKGTYLRDFIDDKSTHNILIDIRNTYLSKAELFHIDGITPGFKNMLKEGNAEISEDIVKELMQPNFVMIENYTVRNTDKSSRADKRRKAKKCYKLVSDSSVICYTLRECYDYLVVHIGYSHSFLSFSQKRLYLDFFQVC